MCFVVVKILEIKVTYFYSKITSDEISVPGEVIICTSNLQRPWRLCVLCPTGNTWMNPNGYLCSEVMAGELLSCVMFSPFLS